jgi:hypothetical protein
LTIANVWLEASFSRWGVRAILFDERLGQTQKALLISDFCFLVSAFDLVELNGLEKARFRAPEVQMRADFCLLLSAFCS